VPARYRGDEVDQRAAEHFLQARACGQHPRHVGFIDKVEQAQDHTIDAGDFQPGVGRLHA